MLAQVMGDNALPVRQPGGCNFFEDMNCNISAVSTKEIEEVRCSIPQTVMSLYRTLIVCSYRETSQIELGRVSLKVIARLLGGTF